MIPLLSSAIHKSVLRQTLFGTSYKSVETHLVEFGVGGEKSHCFVRFLILQAEVATD